MPSYHRLTVSKENMYKCKLYIYMYSIWPKAKGLKYFRQERSVEYTVTPLFLKVTTK